jgi:hypothetical protein
VKVARARGPLAMVMVAVGLVWIGQGLGLLRGQSFMVDDIRWAWIGAATTLAGIGIALAGRRTHLR